MEALAEPVAWRKREIYERGGKEGRRAEAVHLVRLLEPAELALQPAPTKRREWKAAGLH